jgi:hypothetical protein
MIVERRKLLGIIPFGKKRAVGNGERFVLSEETIGGDGQPFETVITETLLVVDGSRIIYTHLVNDKPRSIDTDSGKEINGLKMHDSGCWWNRVYTYSPDKVVK